MKRERILRAIEHDFDVKRRMDVASDARASDRWLEVMRTILKLPVAKWDCPATASGEIDSAARNGKG